VRIVRDDQEASVPGGFVLGEPVSAVVADVDVEPAVVIVEDEDDEEDVAGRLVADSDVLGAGAA
jgi:hypothetical protein